MLRYVKAKKNFPLEIIPEEYQKLLRKVVIKTYTFFKNILEKEMMNWVNENKKLFQMLKQALCEGKTKET